MIESKHPSEAMRLCVLGLLLGLGVPANAQIDVPSDSSDGVLEIHMESTAPNLTVDGNVVLIDLGRASTGLWDQANSDNPGMGIYDPIKWAVVFKYSKVSIAEGMHVSFKNHPSRAPVVWLVQENVDIDGTLDLTGEWNGPGGVELRTPSEPGPGGFRGGAFSVSGIGSGLGPGAGVHNPPLFRSNYGNPQLLPLIGGSGSSVGYRPGAPSGELPLFTFGGGGAILIAARETVRIGGTGAIVSKGGKPHLSHFSHATGGAIRIIANVIEGSGLIDAEPEGRTRIEAALSASPDLEIFPNVANSNPGTTPIIWPPASTPTVRVMDVDGMTSPEDPRAGVATSADVLIERNSPVDILIESQFLPIEGSVQLRVAPKYGASSWHQATYLEGNYARAVWRVTTTLPPGFTVLQARATAP